MLNLDEMNSKAEQAWKPIQKLLDEFCLMPINPVPPKPCIEQGMWKWDLEKQEWIPHSYFDLPTLMVYDFEAQAIARKDRFFKTKKTEAQRAKLKKPEKDEMWNDWKPRCCAIYGLDGHWYYWNAYGVEEGDSKGFKDLDDYPDVMPVPCQRVMIGQNSGAYDRRYLSAEYTHENPRIVHIDTMHLATIIGGISKDSDGNTSKSQKNELFLRWEKFDIRNREQKAVPRWYEECGPTNLKFLLKRYLGMDMDKSIRDDIVNDPTRVTANNLYEYNCGDVYATALLAQVLLQKVRKFIPSAVTWIGMTRVNSSRYFLKDWESFISQSQSQYEEAQTSLARLEDKLINMAINDPDRDTKFSSLDWDLYIRGANAGKPRWIKKIRDSGPMGGNIAPYLLDLYFDGVKVELKKAPQGEPKWFYGDTPLPHPEGAGNNVGTPLTSDYEGFVRAGRLTSKAISSKSLHKLYALLRKTSQWKAYRKRYDQIPRRTWGKDPSIQLSVAELRGTGTISRRATSRVWVVLPKPSDQIGSDVMNYIQAPPGYVMVSADFVSQESRIAAMLADTRVGKYFACPWSQAIMVGEKSKKTDAHNLTAARIKTGRYDAKTINFQMQYGGGQKRLVNALVVLKGIDRKQAELEANEFLNWYKGPEGVALSIFETLYYLAQQEDARTYLLGVKQPNTINPRFVPGRDFWTLRCNWPIQSAGVDEKHALIFLIEHYAKKAGIKAHFACDVHDRVAFFCPEEQGEDLAKIFDIAMENLIHIAYEAATRMWNRITNRSSRKVLDPLENWKRFEKVDISQKFLEL